MKDELWYARQVLFINRIPLIIKSGQSFKTLGTANGYKLNKPL